VKRLSVYLNNISVGFLDFDKTGGFVFEYDPLYIEQPSAYPLSCNLPLRREPYSGNAVRSFFVNILPEGDIRALIARISGISETNDMDLLEKIGGECAGAVSLMPPGGTPSADTNYREITGIELDEMLSEKNSMPLLARHKELRLSLAGMQDKLPVFFNEERLCLPLGNSPSSHILKPDNRYFQGLIYNELFCQMLADSTGLNVPDVELFDTGKNRVYIIKRYDRIVHNGVLKRLHQEDFCQASGLMPEEKYEAEGGPGLAHCFSLIDRYSTRPAPDREQLLRWVIFNYLTGNADAHAKNISFLYRNGKPSLAPFYDLVCTMVWPHLSRKMSMKIGGENRFSWIRKRHWERFAGETGIKPSFVFDSIQEVSSLIESNAERVKAFIETRYGSIEILNAAVKLIMDNLKSNKTEIN